MDIDSTLHHHWDVVSAVSMRRFGVKLPYEEQLTWGLTRLRPEQLEVCVRESHSDQRILAGVPYEGAVATIRGWHAQGHFVQLVSHPASVAAARAPPGSRRSGCRSTICSARPSGWPCACGRGSSC